MSIYVMRRTASEGARALAAAIAGRKVSEVPRLRPGDVLVCWGERVAPVQGVRILNGGPLSNKFEDAVKLRQENVPTIEVVRDTPPVVDATTGPLARLGHLSDGIRRALEAQDWERAQHFFPDFVTARRTLTEAQARRTPPAIWVPRSNHHVGGNDLLNPPRRPDYYVKRLNLVTEYRVHSFLGKSIRTGIKIHREGFENPHRWIRSWDAGWRISYAGVEKRGLRNLAHRAVEALGLQFGAVDIGENQDGSLVVLEVNRAPGLEGGTITAYANAIRNWMQAR